MSLLTLAIIDWIIGQIQPVISRQSTCQSFCRSHAEGGSVGISVGLPSGDRLRQMAEDK